MDARFPQESSLFTPWRDPISGITSYLLSRRVAPMQMGFYFTNPSFTTDGRYLWLYCFYPPGGQCGYGGELAVVDFAADEIRHCPETQFLDASPMVDPDTGEVYWTTGLEVWKRGPAREDRAVLVNVFPPELANGRRPWRLATHLTRSADGKYLAIDAQIGNQWFAGALPLDGQQPFELWRRFEDCCYNHAQFSPTDPDLMLIAQDGWRDAATGRPGQTTDRLWLLHRDGSVRPVVPEMPQSSDHRGHEWWDAGGQHIWYIDYARGTCRANIHSGRPEWIWPNGHTHSHCSRDGRYLVGDIAEAAGNWRLAFHDSVTGKEIPIVSRFPVFSAGRPSSSWSLSAVTPGYQRGNYHVHPHPQFAAGDRYITYTTNVRGEVDLAVVPVSELASACG